MSPPEASSAHLAAGEAALLHSPALPRDEAGAPVFAEPWMASAFALAVSLHRAGIFSWTEWADALSRALKEDGRAPDASDYYQCWVEALTRLVEARGLAGSGEIEALSNRWKQAAEATPHGQPILLANAPAD